MTFNNKSVIESLFSTFSYHNVHSPTKHKENDMNIISFFSRFIIKLIFVMLFGVGVILGISYLLGPPPIADGYVSILYDENGEPLQTTSMQNQQVALENISPYLIDATILTEDRHFYSHYGFDLKGIVRAIYKNIQSSRLKEGASTITQQYARNLYLTHEKTWIRKIKEAFYTIRLEMFYSKDEILAGYLNTIYYGHGAHGIETASQLFFQKSASDLTVAEAAMLAAIPKGPTYYSPFNDEENAYARQRLILNILHDENIITDAAYHEAIKEKFTFEKRTVTSDSFAPYFEQLALNEAARILQLEKEQILSSGYQIYTTLHAPLQKSLQEHIRSYVELDSELEISVIVLSPENGAIKGLIGGKDYSISTYNRAVQAKRMVGSTFKPFLYYSALENGYTPTTMLLSEPTAFVIDENDVYEPSNYNGYYAHKPISLAHAVALSDNIYAVKTNLFLSSNTVIDTTKKFGITSDLPNVPSLALGSASLSLLEMVRAYGVIANGGKELNSYTVEKIIDRNGRVLYERKAADGKQILDPNKAFILTHLMTGMFDRRLNSYMEVTGSSIIDKISHNYAGKSGTTDSDSWMIGFSPEIVTGVWTGYDDNRPLTRISEKTIAKNVWAAAMESAHESKENVHFPIPDGIVEKVIDPETGLLATNDCPVSRTTYFEKGTEPLQYCTAHVPKKEEKEEVEHINFLQQLLQLIR